MYLKKYVLVLCYVLCATSILGVRAIFPKQPKILTEDGNLIIESAYDQNITVRLKGSSALLLNDINVLQALTAGSDLAAGNTEHPEQMSASMTEIRRTLQNLSNRLSAVSNLTSSDKIDMLTRLQRRVWRLLRKVNMLENSLRTNNCEVGPCKNGGTCFDLFDDYHCECASGWTGKTCDEDVDECSLYAGTDLGCQNSAQCVNTIGGYRCVCAKGFTGVHCRDLSSECSKDARGELCGKGVCVPSANEHGYSCICDQGWKSDLANPACTLDVNECEFGRNPCHTTCINLPGTFLCGPCPHGYKGNGITCTDVNECEIHNGGCSTSPNVRCINSEGSYHCGSCPPGWVGDGKSCTIADSNACQDNTLCHPQASCQYVYNTVVCRCPDHMVGDGYGPNGCSALSNPCKSNPCKNGGLCLADGSTYKCVCPFGFDPPNCDSVDRCDPNPCENGGTCSQNGKGSFNCSCAAGFVGRTCKSRRGACGTVIQESSGTFKFPSDVNSNVAGCAWLLRTDENKILNVTFTKFDLANHSDCTKDWLQIHDGRSSVSQIIGRFCGNALPRGSGSILSSGNTLYLWFRTDNRNRNSSFEMSWDSSDRLCGGDINAVNQTHGVISSPGYPGKSPPNRDCKWTIKAPIGNILLIRYFEVNLDNSTNCTADTLKIIDSGEVLEEVCQTSLPQPRYSSSNAVDVIFHTDSFHFDSSFQLHYEVVAGEQFCGGLFTDVSGVIESPKVKPMLNDRPLFTCLYLIQQPPGTRVELEITEMSDMMYHDLLYKILNVTMLEVYDGKTVQSGLIGRWSENKLATKLISTSNAMLVKYKLLYPTLDYRKFKANYRLLCDENIHITKPGSITSLGYPQPYYSNVTCTYTLTSPLHTIITFTITDLDIKKTEYYVCDTGFLEIFYGLSQTDRVCYSYEQLREQVSETNRLRVVFNARENTDKFRGFRLTYGIINLGCGGVLTDPEGTITFAGDKPNSNNCVWVIEAPEGKMISVDFQKFQLGTSCANNSVLEIYTNSTKGGHLSSTYCGSTLPTLKTYSSNIVTLTVKNVNYDGAEFAATYRFTDMNMTCGGNFSSPFGIIRTPNWQNRQSNNKDCIWVIHAPIGHQIEIKVNKFKLDVSPTDCQENYLEIRNGMTKTSPLIGRFCSGEMLPRIPSFTNHLYLHFNSEYLGPDEGFELEWEQTATGCGGSLDSFRGSIHSPHYPEVINSAVQCDWRITVNHGSTVNMKIVQNGGSQPLCNGKPYNSSVLQIYDGLDASSGAQLDLICLNGTIYANSTSNFVFVRYLSDDADGNGFFLSYEANCRTRLDQPRGVIESPNFPNDYPENLDCQWEIVGKKASNISISFSHLKLELASLDCPYDKLELIDMKDDEEVNRRKLCTLSKDIITSVGNVFIVRFTSDITLSSMGFRLEYNRNSCGGYFVADSGRFEAPSYPYAVNADCEWVIETTEDRIVHLDITELYLDDESNSCSDVGLIVSNSKDEQQSLLKECNTKNQQYTVQSAGNTMFVRFFTNGVRTKRILKASYTTKKAKCGGHYRGKKWAITSPNYPKNYQPNSLCEWVFEVDPKYNVKFIIDKLNIEKSVNCSKDALVIYDGAALRNRREPRRMCGNESSTEAFRTETNLLRVNFISDNSSEFTGFAMRMEQACGGVTNSAVHGILQSESNEDYCRWEITAKDLGAHVTMSISHVECSCDGLDRQQCSRDRGVQVFEGIGLTAVLKKSFCQQPENHVVMSSGQSLTVISRKAKLQANYDTIENACSFGVIKTFRGKLSSPLYPNSYPVNVECEWQIEAPRGTFVELTLVKVDIAKSDEGCNEDYLEIRESSANGKLKGIYCTDSEQDIIRTFERAWLKFRSDESGVAAGFLVSWSFVRDNEIVDQQSGYIMSPPIASIQEEGPPFSWRIFVERGNVVAVTMEQYEAGLKIFDGFNEDALPIDLETSSLTSSSNVLYILADNKLLKEFTIRWSSVPKVAIATNTNVSDCVRTIIASTNESVFLSSPGYPHGYGPNLNCEWIVKAEDPSRHAVITLQHVDLESQMDCMSDQLKIFSSKNLNAWREDLMMCSGNFSENAQPQIHGKPYLKVNMNSDFSLNGTGFTSMVGTACGSWMTSPIGLINANSVFNRFTRALTNLTCVWNIEVRPGKRIAFNFDFGRRRLARNQSCDGMYGLVRDGIDEEAPILGPGRICAGAGLVSPLITTSNRAFVKYEIPRELMRSPDRWALWSLQYEEFSDCGGEVRLTSFRNSTNFTTPNYPNIPNTHTECVWLLIAPAGQMLQLDFVDQFDLSRKQCSEEYVEIRDGATELSPPFGQFCQRPSQIRSTGNILYVKFSTNIAEPRNGFRAAVRLAQCGEVFSSPRGSITSKNYPTAGGYPSGSVCEYRIKLSSAYGVRLRLTDIDLPFDALHLDESDHLRIFAVPFGARMYETELKVVYGNYTAKGPIEMEYPEVLIRFFAFKRRAQKFRGFKLDYEHIELCTRDIINDSGEIRYRSTGTFVPCRWRITVPKGRSVRLEIVYEQNYTFLSPISIYDDFDMTTRISTIGSRSRPQVVTSTDNKMMVVFPPLALGFPNHLNVSISARFTSEDSFCPPDLTEESGDLIISQFPNSSFTCQSQIEGSLDETLAIRVKELTYTVTPPFEMFFDVPLRIKAYYWGKTNLSETTIGVLAEHTSLSISQSEHIRLKQFSATYKKHKCGQEITVENSLNLTLPDFPVDYGSLDCVWHLKLPALSTLEVLHDFDASTNCSREYVSIRNGHNAVGSERLRVCGGSSAAQTNLTYMAYIHYHTDRYDPARKLQLILTPMSKCGGRIMLSAAVYRHTLPMAIVFGKNDYRNNMECVWDVSGRIGYNVHALFYDRFFIASGPNCTQDYVEIRQINADDSSTVAQRYCGRETPPALNMTSNRLQVIFRSDGQTTGDGFSLNFEQTCSGVYNVTDQTPQVIKSPILKLGHMRQLQCNYTFVTDSDQPIYLKFTKVFRSFYPNCRVERLKVFRSGLGAEPTTFCGTVGQDIEVSSTEQIKLVYETTFTFPGGFALEYSLSPCGGSVERPTFIRTPFEGPEKFYPAHMDCSWNITAPKDRIIVIRFKELDMESSTDCRADNVAIFKGHEISDGNRTAFLCGNFSSRAPTIRIDSNEALIRVVSDSFIQARGFSAVIEFTKKCDENIALNTHNGTYNLTRHVSAESDMKLNCVYRLTAPEGYQIAVAFQEIKMTANNVNRYCLESFGDKQCSSCDFVEIIDSAEMHSLPIARFCRTKPTTRYTSSGNHLIVHAATFDGGQSVNFQINVSLQPSICGSTKTIVLDGKTVEKLKFPESGQYPPNALCKYTVKSKEPFNIIFDKFNLEPPSDVTGKCLDSVEIKMFAAPQDTHVFCGNHSDYSLSNYGAYSMGELMAQSTITFRSNEKIQASGFEMIFRNSGDCSRNYTTLSGTIQPRLSKVKCQNFINVPENYTITVYMIGVYFISRNCSTHNIKMYDQNTNKLLETICDSQTGKPIFANTNRLRIDWNVDTYIHVAASYIASKAGLGCGGVVSQTQGMISNPMYPDRVRKSMTCRWEFATSNNNKLVLKFNEFDLGTAIYCSSNYVKLIEMLPNGKEKDVRTFCGHDVPADYTSEGHSLAVVFAQSANFDGSGWVMSFNSMSADDWSSDSGQLL